MNTPWYWYLWFETHLDREEDEEWSDERSIFSDEDEELEEEEEDGRSAFTGLSMTSSVMRRNAGLTLLDDRFEKVGSFP
jgi:protein LTV1